VIRKFFKDDVDEHEFKPILSEIETRPLNPLGRFIFWMLIGTLLFFSIWLYMGKIDIVVSARGKIVPDGEIKIIQTLDTGVLSKINFRPGDHVKKGDVLVEIDPSTTEPALDSASEKLNHLSLETDRLNALLNNKPFKAGNAKYGKDLERIQHEIYKSTKDAFDKLISSKEREIEKIDAQYGSLMTEKAKNEELLGFSRETMKRLENVKDIIATETYENGKKDIVQYEKTLESIVYKIEELRQNRIQRIEEIAYEKSNFQNTNLKELADKQGQLVETKSEIDQIGFKNRKQRIEAPIDGFINELYIHTIGGVVTPAQNLLSIVPDDTSLVIESTIMNKDVGFVKSHMPVSIKIDTFDFQKFGMIDGEVIQVSKDSIVDKELGPIYKMIVRPKKLWLMVEGKKTEITSGMTLTSEVNVGKRRIIEFFIYPLIKYLDEGMSVL
jgi:hemolysin D